MHVWNEACATFATVFDQLNRLTRVDGLKREIETPASLMPYK